MAAPAQVWCDTGDGLLLLHVPSGTFYGLNSTGEYIWRLAQEPVTAVELRDALLEDYDVHPTRCESELLLLIGQLTAAGLLRVAETRVGRSEGGNLASAAPQQRHYTEPRLDRFGDRNSCLLWWVGLEHLVAGYSPGERREASTAGEAPARSVPATLPGGGPPAGTGESPLALLVCCARPTLTPDDAARLRERVAEVTDWEPVATAAERHGMLPLLSWHLHRTCADLVPAATLRSLRREFMRNAVLALPLAGELQRICTDFGDHGILAVPYKGPALAATLYGNVALRRRGDLDLLLRRQDIPRARELLLSCGYTVRHELSAGAAEHLLRAKYHVILDRSTSPRATVELHWAFTSRDLDVRLDLEALAPRLDSARLGGTALPTFSREDQLLILCIHGSKHRWKRLEWIAAVAELLRSTPELAWAELLDRSAALRSRRMLLLGITLARSVLSAPLPAELEEVVRRDRTLARLAERVCALLFREAMEPGNPAASTHGALRFRVQLQERFSDKVRIVAYHLTTPAVGEWRVLSIAGAAVPMHALFRPLDMLIKATGRAYRNLRRSSGRPKGEPRRGG